MTQCWMTGIGQSQRFDLFFWILSVLCCTLLSPSIGYPHGGIPRVLNLDTDRESVWMIDTLGFFRAALPTDDALMSSPLEWSWLCDDAVDPQAGVDVAVRLSDQVLLAVSRSGVYRSETLGCHFDLIGAPLNQHAVGGISPHPTRAGEAIVYTRTLGRANDLYLTEDQGRSWTASGLTLEGSIFHLWRHPLHPQEVWINHAEGLSYSEDGGRLFEEISFEAEGLTLRPRELSLLGGGIDYGGAVRLFMSVNRYPTSLLLTSHDRGVTWRQIHSVNDSYESLLYIDGTLMVSTPFEGLFVYDLPQLSSEDEAQADEIEDRIWEAQWRQYADQFIGCLTADEDGRVWACGRAAPTQWLVAYSIDQGENWRVALSAYADVEAPWACPSDAPSVLACNSRCLSEGCDPSGLPTGGESGAGLQGMTGGTGAQETLAPSSQGAESPSASSSGCHLTSLTSTPLNLEPILGVGLWCVLFYHRRKRLGLDPNER